MRLTTSQGTAISLGQKVGVGGEGTVYKSATRDDIAIKLYHQPHRVKRKEKILAMTSAGLARAPFVAFPIEPVFDNGAFAGFTMPFAPKRKPIHEVYSPSSRRQEFPRANFAFLLRVALNIASAVAAVHERGCVVGDMNHSGILVATDATATLIDTDSFQFSFNNKLFLCEVGVEEFTASRVAGQVLGRVYPYEEP